MPQQSPESNLSESNLSEPNLPESGLSEANLLDSNPSESAGSTFDRPTSDRSISGIEKPDSSKSDNPETTLTVTRSTNAQRAKSRPSKQRIDLLLVERQLCESRALAQRLIRAGEVKVEHQVIDKPGTEIDTTAKIEIKQKSAYVSRGGEKLAKALAQFEIRVRDRICLDGGISTGGFTDCLLQHGAQRVYGVDVGYGQVAWKLQTDARVTIKERANLRHLLPADLYGESEIWPDLGVVDVSFISLVKVLPALHRLLREPRELLLLVKPQFEVGREKIGKKGVVREAKDQAGAIWQVLEAARGLDWGDRGLTWSPITGPAGNVEYLLWLSQAKEEQEDGLGHLTWNEVRAIAQEARLAL